MTRQAIIDRVKLILDEVTPVDSELIHPIDLPINELLDEALRTLLKEFPVDKLWHSNHDVDGIENDNCITIQIPNEVIRVASVKLNIWPRAVHESEFVKGDSVQIAWQGNTATRSTKNRPLVASSQTRIGETTGRTLKCFGIEPGARVSELNVVTFCKPEQLNDDLVTPLTYLVAFLTASHMDRPEIADIAYKQYLKNLQ